MLDIPLVLGIIVLLVVSGWWSCLHLAEKSYESTLRYRYFNSASPSPDTLLRISRVLRSYVCMATDCVLDISCCPYGVSPSALIRSFQFVTSPIVPYSITEGSPTTIGQGHIQYTYIVPLYRRGTHLVPLASNSPTKSTTQIPSFPRHTGWRQSGRSVYSILRYILTPYSSKSLHT